MMEAEILRMKESYESSKEEYIKRIKVEHERMLDSIDELRKIIEKQEININLASSKGMTNSNNIRELQNRSEELHRVIEKCQRQVTLI